MTNFQRGIHWPYCIDGSCCGCMPIIDFPLAPTLCTPAIGIHAARCECKPEPKEPVPA